MGIRFAVDPSSRIVHYDVVRCATSDEAGEFLNAALTHQHFERGFNFLDRRGVRRPDAAGVDRTSGVGSPHGPMH